MLRAFFDANDHLFQRLYPRFSHVRFNIWDCYNRRVAAFIDERPGQTVVDAGAGRTCQYAPFVRRRAGTRIIGVDVSETEMRRNADLDERRVADVSRALPLPDASADLVVSRCVLEHLPRVESFFAEVRRVLKPNGRFVHLFASRFSPSAVLNRVLPEHLTKSLLALVRPWFVETSGFRSFYDHCTCSALLSVLRRQGLQTTEVRVSYSQSEYYAFFLPLSLLSLTYEWVLYTLDVPSLAANALVIGRKRL